MSHMRLRHGEARGFGMVSSSTSQMRHLHSEEAALLCTVLVDFIFPEPPRTALCLLGEIAAPAQVLLLQAQVLPHLQCHFQLTSEICPNLIVQQYMAGLMQQCAHRWTLARMYMPMPRQIQLLRGNSQPDHSAHSRFRNLNLQRRGCWAILCQGASPKPTFAWQLPTT